MGCETADRNRRAARRAFNILIGLLSIILSLGFALYETASPEGGGVFPGASRVLAAGLSLKM